jgi:hypothetical protein
MAQFVSGSIYVNVMGTRLDNGVERSPLPGETVKGHKHCFDHTSIFFCGDWHVKAWTAEGELEHDFTRTAPFHLLIDKDCLHEFTFLGGAPQGLAWCVYSHRSPDGEVIEQSTGWHEAYSPKG